VSEMSENKEKEAKTMMICVIVVVFYFSQEWQVKKKHEDNGCAPLSSCLKGAKIRGKNDNNLCDHHHFIFFKGMTIGKKKDTKKNKGPTCKSSSKSRRKKPWKWHDEKKTRHECCSYLWMLFSSTTT
jgi:hypothetical protein